MSRHWIAVASADHARRGRELGFMQVCHGKGGPLRRVQPGDGVVYYSPTTAFRGKDHLQAFTIIGRAKGEVYQADIDPEGLGDGFRPFRRDVDYVEADEAPILPLLGRLEFTRAKKNWGYAFRFGLMEISKADFDTVAQAMGARV
jgi:hypothetical protein